MDLGSQDLRTRIKNLLLDESKFDVKFRVGTLEVETFGANSLILSTASEAFGAQFYTNFQQPSIKDPPVIEIPDGTPDGFRVLLQFIYTENASITGDNVISVLYLAKKYFLTGLYNRAIGFIERQIDVGSFYDILRLSDMYNELEFKCFMFFDKNAPTLMAADAFLSLSRTTLEKILSRDSLQADEMVLYARTVDWAKERIKNVGGETRSDAIRATLGNLIYLIRFPTMDSAAFADGPAAAKILTDAERADIYSWFTLQRSAGLFTTKPRFKPRVPHPCKGHDLRCKNGECALFNKLAAPSVCLRDHPSCIYCSTCDKFVPEYASTRPFVRQGS